MTRRARLVAAAIVGMLSALVLGSPVIADPAGPTDYLSEVIAVDPPTAGVEVRVVGGDSFVALVARPGTEVIVVGYQGEPYLWFRPDGSVLENRNSPSTYTNEDRFGGDVPAFATPDADPEWVEIGSSGRWAWHDHRAHWMQQIRPPGREPGDQILEAVIPLTVDGDEVDVTVISTWQPAPSTVPVWVGAILGVVATAAAWMLRQRSVVGLVAVPPAVAALVVGVWQFGSLPAETDPRLVWWLLPALAVAASSGAVVAGLLGARFVSWALMLVAAVETALWGWLRRDGLTSALIPTSAPGWFDRMVTILAIAAGLGLVIVSLSQLFTVARHADAEPAGTGDVGRAVSGSRAPTGSPRPARR